jgi:hypothetical protein
VIIQKLSTMESIQLKPADFLGLHVKRMCITCNAIVMEEATHILSICTNIVDLAFWLSPFVNSSGKDIPALGPGSGAQDTPIAHVLSRLPLQRLEVRYERILQLECESVRVGELPGWCATLTHLDIFCWTLSSRTSHIPQPPLLLHLPALTHLSIGWSEFEPGLHEKEDIASFLAAKPLLQVVLVDTEEVDDDHVPIDDRIVYLPASADPVREWANQGRRLSKWALAEKVVAKRRRNMEGTSRDEPSDIVVAIQTLSL